MRRGAVVVVLLAALLPGCSTARDGTAARLSGAVPTSADSQDPREPPRLGAWYVAEVAGTPGAFVPHQVVGTHLQVPCGGPGRCFQPGLQLTAAAVGRSPATAGAQVVLVLENVYALNGLGGWFVQQQDAHQITIPAGQPVGYTLDRSWLLATGGAKHVKLVLIWADETGRALGMQGIHMSDAGDYVCRTRFAWACSVGDGFVSVAQPS